MSHTTQPGRMKATLAALMANRPPRTEPPHRRVSARDVARDLLAAAHRGDIPGSLISTEDNDVRVHTTGQVTTWLHTTLTALGLVDDLDDGTVW